MNRVVVTGVGVVSPIGIGKKEFWKSLETGKSGVSHIKAFNPEEHSTKIAAEVNDFEPTDFIPKKEAKRMDRFVQFASAASQMAAEDANLEISDENSEKVGISIGSGIGGLTTLEENHRKLIEKGPKRVSPFFIPMMIANMASGKVSIDLGARGPNLTLVTACATAAHAIGEALELLRRGKADVMITGGAEATISPLAIAGFGAMKALSTRNDEPEKASRPFDKDRDGFVMGEGAGILILETLDHAKERGAPIYAEVSGFGMTGDAHHMTAPCPESKGAIACMEEAIEDANISKTDIQYVNAHGTSTHYNDRLETNAIKEVFSDHASSLAVNSTKSMTGHLLGAAGGIESIATVLSMEKRYIHPTINLENQDPDLDLDYVPNKGRSMDISGALVNNFGFGGTNASLVFKSFEK
ncbi:beta-ketoacyl-ACP synthase II [Natranaerobius trueperi]|uniref:3-oxoacyl-[acyl-carrier-protein] synthase 2 n=1 Tax=Natranaerobius trueperi TaxID=759412 RepID=A0A226C0S3_9FIRM|nr:beta-ketoacyl-ACP synthase II [Natranaerobius trueperi]OWZ84194.1 beta-ketoacyl-[acyl-carrier-protein] synthase II [Natranaerobius trueperi]